MEAEAVGLPVEPWKQSSSDAHFLECKVGFCMSRGTIMVVSHQTCLQMGINHDGECESC